MSVSTTSRILDEIGAAREVVPRLLMLVGEDKTASWQYRVSWPCMALSNKGFVADWCLAQEINNLMPLIAAGRYNVVLTPRAHWDTTDEADAWIAAMHGAGMAWVYELDDDGWSTDIVKRQARIFNEEWAKGEERLEWERKERIRLIRLADGVVVSSEGLASVARKFTDKPVFCVPNLLNVPWFLGRQQDAKRIVPPLTVGWSGGSRDEIDLEIVAQAWTYISEKYPAVQFVVHGASPNVLVNSVPGDRLTKLTWSSLPDYPRALMNFDIACCAVAPGVEFNLSKTAIKWYETSMSGAACVVSKTLYGPEVHDGLDGLIADTVDDWKAALSRVIEDKTLRKRLQKNARRSVETKHSLEVGWTKWVEALAGAREFFNQNSLAKAA